MHARFFSRKMCALILLQNQRRPWQPDRIRIHVLPFFSLSLSSPPPYLARQGGRRRPLRRIEPNRPSSIAPPVPNAALSFSSSSLQRRSGVEWCGVLWRDSRQPNLEEKAIPVPRELPLPRAPLPRAPLRGTRWAPLSGAPPPLLLFWGLSLLPLPHRLPLTRPPVA